MNTQDPSIPTTVTFNSVLSQDFITSNGVLVDSSKAGQVAVFRNVNKAHAVEALVLSDAGGEAGQIFYLAHDPKSLTGWSFTPVLDAGGNKLLAREVLAFTTTWGAIDAFYVGTGGHLNHMWLDPKTGAWTSPYAIGAAPTDLSQLAVAFSPGASEANGALVVYCIDPNGKVFFYYGKNSLWTPATMPIGGAASSWTLALRDESSWLLTMVASQTFIFRPGGGDPIGGVQQGRVAWAWGALGSGGLKVAGGAIDNTNPTDRVVLNATNMAGTPATMMLMLAGASDPSGGHQVAWLINPGASDQAHGTIAGTSFADAAIVKSTTGFVNIYGIDKSLNLFTLRQIGFNPGDMSSGYGTTQTWGPVFQLDTRMQRMYADPSPGDTPVLIAVDADVGALHLYVQDPTTNLWLILPITLPSTQRFEINRWRTEINVYDQDGQQMANAPIRLSAQSAVDVEINGAYFVIDSAISATVTTNALGKATVASLARTLAPPAFTVAAEGLPTQNEHSPAGPVNDYLAGTGSIFSKGPFDAAAVKQLSPQSPIDPKVSLNAIQQCAQLGQQKHPEGAARVLAVRRSAHPVHVYARMGGQGIHHPCAARSDADAFLAANLNVGSFWGDVWDATKHFAGDVWHGIKEGLHRVASVVVDFTNSVIQLVIEIGGQLVKLADWVIKGVEDAMQAITSVFNWIEAKVEAVIDWLKMLFDFKAIWNTKEALKTQLLVLPDYLISQFGTWSALIENDFFARQKAKIGDYFAAAISKYGGRSFAGLDGWTAMGQPPSSSSKIAGSATPSDLTDNANINWFQDKVSSNAPAQIDGIPATGGDPIQAFFDAVVDVGQDLLKAFSDFGNGVVALLQADSVDSFENIAISTILALARDLVFTLLDLFDALIQGLLSLATLAMQGLKAAMTAELKLGFINDVYGWVASKVGGSATLTMGDLVALIAAFPITIVYKLIAGVDSEPFPGGRLPTVNTTLAATAAQEPSKQVRQAFGTTAGVLTAIGAVWRVTGDVMTTSPGWLTPVSWGTTGIRLAFTHPGWLQWGPLEWGTTSAIAANLLWLGPLAYTLNDMYKISDTVQGGVVAKLKSKGLTDWVFGDVTKVASSVFGVFMLGNTIYSLTQTSTPPLAATAQVIEGIVSPFSFLTMTPIRDAPEIGPIAVALKVALDLVGGIGGSALEITSAWTEIAS